MLVLRTIPFLGPVRVALLMATMQTPWRFRTKRHLWAYAGLAVVTRTSAEFVVRENRPVRRRRAPLTRGLKSQSQSAAQVSLQGSGDRGDRPRRILADFL